MRQCAEHTMHCYISTARVIMRTGHNVVRALPFFFILSPVSSLLRIVFTIMLIPCRASGGSDFFRNFATIRCGNVCDLKASLTTADFKFCVLATCLSSVSNGIKRRLKKSPIKIKDFHFVSELDICLVSLDTLNYVSIKTQIRHKKRQTELLFDQRIRWESCKCAAEFGI